MLKLLQCIYVINKILFLNFGKNLKKFLVLAPLCSLIEYGKKMKGYIIIFN